MTRGEDSEPTKIPADQNQPGRPDAQGRRATGMPSEPTVEVNNFVSGFSLGVGHVS